MNEMPLLSPNQSTEGQPLISIMDDMFNCLSNAMHSSIGQNIKSPGVSGLRSEFQTLNGHNSATCHPIDFVFGSRLGWDRQALFNLTAHEFHELHYDIV